MDQNKGLTTMINFHQTYEVMKIYLSKKSFNYVYEQCVKYYNKNQVLLTNHEVMVLIKLVFYVLKKKMINKINPTLKNFSYDSVHQIYSVMTNVYCGWESAISVQLNAENPEFFQMLFRNNHFKKKNNQFKSQSFLFQSKKDYIVTGKLNIESKLYIFFKQSLRMIINSLIIFFYSLDMSKIGKMSQMINKCQQMIMNFSEHQFPVQKIQFYLIKCQIRELLQKESDICIKINIKYEFPTGLFQLIYKNLTKWKQAKLCHYIRMLLRLVFFTVRNEIISIKDAYILGNEVKILIYCVKRKDSQPDTRLSTLSRKGIIDSKSALLSHNSIKKLRINPRTNQKNYANRSSKFKNKYLNILRTILAEIQNYIESRKQIDFIIKAYMQDICYAYKSNRFCQNDEIDKNETNSPFLRLNPRIKSLYSSKRQNQHDEDHNHESSSPYVSQETKRKQNQIIIKNIINIKYKKKLTLASHGRQSQNLRLKLDTKKNSSSSQTFQSTKLASQKRQGGHHKIFSTFFKKIVQNGFKQISVFKNDQKSLSQPINFLQQSSSDQDNEMQNQFEVKRRQQINDINNRFYKKSNPNYQQTNQSSQDSKADLKSFVQKSVFFQNDDQQNDQSGHATSEVNSKIARKTKKISEDFQFEEIKLLDEVIKDKIFKYLNIQLFSLSEIRTQVQAQNYSDNLKGKMQPKKQNMITDYREVLQKTQNLKKQVDELNKQRNLMFDKLSYKSAMIKVAGKYQQKSQENQQMNAGILKDLQNLYKTKNNLTEKASKCIDLYKKLLRIDCNYKPKTIFEQTVHRYSKIYDKYGQNLSIIGQIEDQSQNTHRKDGQIHIIEYIVKNRPISLLQKTLKTKQLIKKFNHHSQSTDRQVSANKNQIALRDNFDNLRGNICKSQFNDANSLTKNFVGKTKIT